MAIQLQGSNAVPIYGDSGSNAARIVLYDSAGNPLVVAPDSVIGATQKVLPVGGAVENNWAALRVDRMGNMRPGNDTLSIRDPCEGTVVNTAVWTASTTSMTQTQAQVSGINLNAGNYASGAAYSILTSSKQLPLLAQAPLRARFKARVVFYGGSVVEFGFGAPTGTTAQIPNGAVWRYTSTGTVVPVLCTNGSDVVQGTDVSGLLNATNYYVFEVVVTDQDCVFSIYSAGLLITQQTLFVPAAQPLTWAVTHLPVFTRLYTISAPSSAPYVYLRDTLVQTFDLAGNEPWTHQLAGTGLGGEVSPTAFSQTSNWSNSAAPSNAALSNTAAGYTTLGGQFGFAAVAGAATDYCLFAFAVPAPYSFFLTGLHITAYNTGAAGATTPTLLAWGAFCQSGGASLATGTCIRVPLGAQYFPVGAAIGQCADKDLDITLDPPLRTDGNKYVGIILRMPVATSTASQVFQGSVLMKGYFE